MANKPLKTIKFPGLPDIYTIESGLSDAQKESILACFQRVAWTTEEGQQLYQALYDSFYPDVRIASLSAVFTQGSRVITPTDSLNSLKQNLVVTATYYNGTTATITDYALNGTLTAGTSIITAIYGGKTATFEVEVARNYLTMDNIESSIGFSNVTVTRGTVNFDTNNVKTFSILAVKPSAMPIKFTPHVYAAATLDTDTPYQFFVFRKDGNDFYACDGEERVYKFTYDSENGLYTAQLINPHTDITQESYTGAFKSECVASLTNGTLTIKFANNSGLVTFTNANFFGYWSSNTNIVAFDNCEVNYNGSI